MERIIEKEKAKVCDQQKNCFLLKKATIIIESFIRSCSHKLKSPLTSIGGLAMVAERSNDLAEVKQYVGLIHQSAVSMISMIHTLEEYLDAQKREFDNDEIVARQLVERILQEEALEIEKQSISVSTEIEQPHKWVSDVQSTYIILRNLLRNAIQFSNQDVPCKKINIRIGVASDKIALEVTDNGIGISEPEQTRIFEPFHRGSEQSKGNGLGLFLVKGLIDRLDATMSVSSTEKKGTVVRISIPNKLAA